MTLEEYGAWFRGFSETMPSPPGLDRWNLIKERVVEVDGQPTTRSSFHTRYWHQVSPAGEVESFDILAAMEALGHAEASRFSASSAR